MTDLLGIPFALGGRDPGEGLDCYGLTIEAGRRLGVDVPDFWDKIAEVWESVDFDGSELVPAGWERVSEPFPVGAILLMFRSTKSEQVSHVAIMWEPGLVLETEVGRRSRFLAVSRCRDRIHSAWRAAAC